MKIQNDAKECLGYWVLAEHTGHDITVKLYASKKDGEHIIPSRAELFCRTCRVIVAEASYQKPCKRLHNDDGFSSIVYGGEVIPTRGGEDDA